MTFVNPAHEQQRSQAAAEEVVHDAMINLRHVGYAVNRIIDRACGELCPTTQIQACRPEDRTMAATPEGAEMIMKAASAIAADPPRDQPADSPADDLVERLRAWMAGDKAQMGAQTRKFMLEAADLIEGTKLVMDSQQKAIEGQDKIITELEQRIERDAQDAERWRKLMYLGTCHHDGPGFICDFQHCRTFFHEAQGIPEQTSLQDYVDAAIDAAMADAARGKGE